MVALTQIGCQRIMHGFVMEGHIYKNQIQPKLFTLVRIQINSILYGEDLWYNHFILASNSQKRTFRSFGCQVYNRTSFCHNVRILRKARATYNHNLPATSLQAESQHKHKVDRLNSNNLCLHYAFLELATSMLYRDQVQSLKPIRYLFMILSYAELSHTPQAWQLHRKTLSATSFIDFVY